MKKLILGILCIALFMTGAAIAYPLSSGTVTDVPAPGLWKSHLSANQKLGAKCQIGGNEFQYVLNKNTIGTQEFQGQPAFWNFGVADGYTVGSYEGTSSYEAFAGIWYCDAWGDTTIKATGEGWIVISGVCEAYLADIGGDITKGDILIGYVTSEAGGDAGDFYLTWLRNELTGAGVGTAESWVISWPRAMDAQAESASTLKTIMVRP